MDEQDFKLLKFKKHSGDDEGENSSKTSNNIAAVDEFDGPMENFPKISIPADSYSYRNNHVHAGYAIIFNHKIIKGEEPRRGTDQDKSRLKKCLGSLGFVVKTYDNLSFSQITDVLEHSSMQNYSDFDCLCITVLSHGENGKVYAEDMAYPVERLWTPFLGNNCKSLINKPKIFFIQACRGEKLDPGVQYRGFTTMSRGLDVPDAGPERLVSYAIPSTADLLVMYSTYEDNYSWRNPVYGSWFIQSLCYELEKFITSGKKETELFYLLTGVCRRVAYEYQSNVPNDETKDEMKEMPQIVSTLTKMFYLQIKD